MQGANGEELFKFESSVVGGAIPKEYIPAVGEGIEEATHAGILGSSSASFASASPILPCPAFVLGSIASSITGSGQEGARGTYFADARKQETGVRQGLLW